jgi:hypothetical protein
MRPPALCVHVHVYFLHTCVHQQILVLLKLMADISVWMFCSDVYEPACIHRHTDADLAHCNMAVQVSRMYLHACTHTDMYVFRNCTNKQKKTFRIAFLPQYSPNRNQGEYFLFSLSACFRACTRGKVSSLLQSHNNSFWLQSNNNTTFRLENKPLKLNSLH